MDNKQRFVPDEIVADIILRMHLNLKPLFRLKLISKQWNSIISNPTFGQRYLKSSSSSPSSSWHRCVLFYPNMMHFQICSSSSSSSVDDALPSLYLPAFPQSATSYTPYTIVASSNGLILSQFAIKLQQELEFEFLVSNPLTKQSVKLPRLFVRSTECLRGDITYKVVFIETKETVGPGSANNSTIRIFSSDIGSWSGGQAISCPGKVFKVGQEETFTRKGVVHWFDQDTRSMITYDPYDKLDRFCCIMWPSGPGTFVKDSMCLVHFGDEDFLKYGDIEHHNHTDNLRVLDYDKAAGEWILEKMCPISREQKYTEMFLRNRKKLVTFDSCNGESLWYISEIRNFENRVTTHVTCDNPSKGWTRSNMSPVFDDCCQIFNMYSILPIELSPWSSPLHVEDGSNSSLVLGNIYVFPIRLPSF